MKPIKASISCNLDSQILQASLPLFSESKVEAIEWSFDTLYNHRNIPDWFVQLLDTFSEGEGLIGHGVFFSLFTGRWTSEQERWLQHLTKVSSRFQFQHVTEHFGFMTGADFHKGAPISIPLNKTTLAIGHDRLQRIYQACECPVGLENLAFTYSLDEVKRHGDFLDRLVEPVNGFIILDLHNLYCQLHNFNVSFDEMIKGYNLDRVREIHISGGSWQESSFVESGKVRRDTHDDNVPEEVFDLLKKTIPMCRNLSFVVLEQIGIGLKSEQARSAFRADFKMMKQIISEVNELRHVVSNNSFFPESKVSFGEVVQDEKLYQQQMVLSKILETSADLEAAKSQLKKSNLEGWETEKWADHMLETVLDIAKKWKDGF